MIDSSHDETICATSFVSYRSSEDNPRGCKSLRYDRVNQTHTAVTTHQGLGSLSNILANVFLLYYDLLIFYPLYTVVFYS